MNIIQNLSKVANQVKDLDSKMSYDIEKIAKQLASSLTDDELDLIIDQVNQKVSVIKEAKLINEGDIVVCVDNFSPLYKGRRYFVSDSSIPGFLGVKEIESQGSCDVGVFAINRFVLDNNEQ
jgi:hypothetical protein